MHLLLCSGQCFVWQSTLQYAAIPQRLHLCLVWAAQTMHTNRGSPVLSRCLPASVPPFFAAPVTGLSEHELSIFTGLLPRDACVWHGTSSRRSAAVLARPPSTKKERLRNAFYVLRLRPECRCNKAVFRGRFLARFPRSVAGCGCGATCCGRRVAGDGDCHQHSTGRAGWGWCTIASMQAC